MDAGVLGNDVQNVNVLTVIASESYESFAKGLQSEIAEDIADRPRAVTRDLFLNRVVTDDHGNEMVIDSDTASAIMYEMTVNRYVDRKGVLTDKYYEDKANGELKMADEVKGFEAAVVDIIDSIYDPKAMTPENARSNNVELQVDEEKLNSKEFKALWSRINAKSVYVVDFDTDELVRKSIAALDSRLRVAKIYFKVESGSMVEIQSKEQLQSGAAFIRDSSSTIGTEQAIVAGKSVTYDLVGRIVESTGLPGKLSFRSSPAFIRLRSTSSNTIRRNLSSRRLN